MFCMKGALNTLITMCANEIYILMAAWLDPVDTAAHINLINLM